MDKTASIEGKKYEYVSAEIHEYSPELTEKEKAAAAFYVLMAEEFGKGTTAEFCSDGRVKLTYGRGDRKPADGTFAQDGAKVVIKDVKDYESAEVDGEDLRFFLPVDNKGTVIRLTFKQV